MNLFLLNYLANSYIYKNCTQITRSNIHAIYTFFISILYLNRNLIQDYYLNLIWYSFFYSIFDINYLLKKKIKGYQSLVIHHGLIIYVISYINFFCNPTNELTNLMALNYLTEISTPFFNRSFQLMLLKQINTNEYKIINTLLVLIFGTSRVLIIPYLLSHALNLGNNIVFCQGILSSMNVIWFYKICKYYKKIMPFG